MRISDPCLMNDWKIQDFLVIVLAVQFSVLGLLGLTFFGFDIPIFRQVIGFFYLTFIPGVVLLRVSKVHNLGRMRTLMYSVGLSIAFLMLIGLFINVFCPVVGISKPISMVPVVSTVSAAVIILCILSYVRDRDFSATVLYSFNRKAILSPMTWALCALPLLSIIGTYFMNQMNSNTILLILLGTISIIPILTVFRRFPTGIYPLAIFAIALSLLFHNTLISSYLTGWDIQSEFYFASLVKANSYWLSSIPSTINAMLSVVILAPIFSIVCSLDLVWVFKIFYPVFFSLVPLGLYEIFRKYLDDNGAFLSCFFFMSLFVFYNELPSLARQEIAELFLVLLMLLMVERGMKLTKKATFGVIFAFSLIVSHYGVSYIFMFSLLFVWVFSIFRRWGLSREHITNSDGFVFLYCVLTLAWYIYVSSSSAYLWALRIGENILVNLSEFANPVSVQGLSIITSTARSQLYEIAKILYLFANILISVGIFALLTKRTKLRFDRQYVLFSLINFALLIGGITIPYFASAIGTTRLYHIALIFLAPFCVVGAQLLWDTLSKSFAHIRNKRMAFLKMLSVFLAVNFLFSSGLIYEIARDRSSSVSLNNRIDFPIFSEQEVLAAGWLKKGANKSIPIYSDLYRQPLLVGILGNVYDLELYPETSSIMSNVAYLYCGYRNAVDGEISLWMSGGAIAFALQNLTLYTAISESDRIYDSNGANLYSRTSG